MEPELVDGERWLVFHRTVYSLRRQCLAGAFTTTKGETWELPRRMLRDCPATEELYLTFLDYPATTKAEDWNNGMPLRCI